MQDSPKNLPQSPGHRLSNVKLIIESPKSKGNLVQDDNFILIADPELSVESDWQSHQLDLCNEKYNRLRFVKNSINQMKLPGLPVNVKFKKARNRGTTSMSKLPDIFNSPMPIGKTSELLTSPSKIRELIEKTTKKTPKFRYLHPSNIIGNNSLQQRFISRGSVGNLCSPLKPYKKINGSPRTDPVKTITDYCAKLILDKTDAKVNKGLFVPMASRESATRIVGRSISVQKVARSNIQRKRKHRRNKSYKNRHNSPSSLIERATTIYKKGFGQSEIGKFSVNQAYNLTDTSSRSIMKFLLSMKSNK